MFVLILLTLVYFLPTIVASHRGHGVAGILVINLFLGWTGVCWIALLLWALLSCPRWYGVQVYHSYYGWHRY